MGTMRAGDLEALRQYKRKKLNVSATSYTVTLYRVAFQCCCDGICRSTLYLCVVESITLIFVLLLLCT